MKGLKPFLSLAVGILGCAIMAGCAGSVPHNGPAALNFAQFTVTDGVIGISYKFLLIATGGTKPYTWTVSQGQLPPGLSLTTDGIISGTPTTLGKYSFTVKVIDSQSPVQAYNTLQTSITVNPALGCCTGTLPTGTVGQAYDSTLTASNGLQPYSYTLADPTNQPLPDGLTLTTTPGIDGNPAVAEIKGTPTTAGVFTFSVQATDADSEVATAQFTITIIGKFQGPYVLYFNGFDHDQPFYDVAQLVASNDVNGSGTITGVLDQMGPGTSVTSALPVTGSYALDAHDNFGTLILTRSDNHTSLTFNIIVSASASGDSRLILADPNAPYAYGSGLLKVQTTSTLPGITANYSFGLSGTDAGGHRYASAGMFALGASSSGSQPITGGEEDINNDGTVSSQVAITGGNLTQLDPNTGRGTYSITTGSGTQNYVYYLVSATELVSIGSDTGGPFTLADIQQQLVLGASGFSNASLKGQSVLGMQGVDTSNGSAVPAAAAGVVAFDGAGNIAGPTATDGTVLPGYYTDESDGGTVSAVQYATGTYNVDPTCGNISVSCGRVTVNLSGAPTQPVWYLIGSNAGFVLDTNPSVMAGTLQMQNVPQALFNIKSIAGSYLGNTLTPVLPSITNELDVGRTPSFTTPVWSQTFDSSGPAGPVNQGTFTGSYNCGATEPACSDLGSYYGRFVVTGPGTNTTPIADAYVLGTASSGITGGKGGVVSLNVGQLSDGSPDPNPRLTMYQH